MRILIIGASGLVGGAIFKLCKKNNHTVFGTYNKFPQPGLFPLDISNQAKISEYVNQFKPEAVIIPAAFADVDGCEKNPKLCNKINRDGVRNILTAAKTINPLVVFFSTDYVFDGKNGPYSEEDRVNPLSVYAKVKLEMEEYIRNNCPKFLIIRTCGVYGWEAQNKNFVVRLIDKLRKKESVAIVTDQIGTPTYVENLAAAVCYLIEKNYHGLYHVTGTSVLPRFEFAKTIAEIFNLDKNLIKPITTDQINQPAQRPMRGGLKTDKVQAILPFKLLSAREGLEKMKRELKVKN